MQFTAPALEAANRETLGHREFPLKKPPLFILIVLCAVVVTILDRPPRALPKQAPLSVFSAERAAEYLSVIGRAPHPLNSAEHDVVRDYIAQSLRDLGYSPEIQRTTNFNENSHIPGALDNIACRLKGSSTEKAVLIVAHYDSVPAGPGTSDDGVSVASMLETARILKSLPQLKRDVIFLFTDGEERGALGAQAFVSEHPWAHDAGVVLNFEARGTSGPSIMFETSDRNGWLIKNFAEVAPHPVANSLSYEIYKRLPAGSDLTIFKRAGYSGLNFAFIEGFVNYHSSHDSVQNLNHGSMQQQGDYMLALAQQFGNAGSDDPRPANLVYFDVLGQFLVRYSQTIATVVSVITGLVVAGAMYLGFRAKRLRFGVCLGGLVCSITGILITAISAQAVAWPVLVARRHFFKINDGPIDDATWYILAFCLIGLACSTAFYLLVSKRIGADNLMGGSFIAWMFLVTVVSFFLPGGTYLFIWPLLFTALAWFAIFARTRMSARATGSILFLGSLPAVVIMIPMIHKIFAAFAAGATVIVSGLLGLLLSLLIGPITMEPMRRRWLPISFLAGGLGVLVIAIVTSKIA